MNKLENRLNELKKADIKIDKLKLSSLKMFKENLKNLTDYRQQSKCTYKIWDVVTYVFIATLARQDT